MKVWVTKYALTSGIEEVEVMRSLGTPSLVYTQGPYVRYFHGQGNDWHLTEKDAKLKAEEMRQKKIKSLRKQIDKLEKFKF